jgi:flagellin
MYLNNITGGLYVDFARNMRHLASSSRKLASGSRVPTLGDGAGDLAVANRLRQTVKASNALATSIETGKAITDLQDTLLQSAAEIIGRVYELSVSAQDPTKTGGDLAGLDAEAQALITELGTYTSMTYNNNTTGPKVLDYTNTQAIKYGVDGTDSINITGACLANISNVTAALTYNMTDIASAQTFSGSLTNTASGAPAYLGQVMGKVGANISAIGRVTDATNSKIAGFMNAESAIRDVNVASESTTFTQEQVKVAAGQSILAQAANFAQGTLRFFN